jgi:nucleotide-binding universal stress UspA family protein
VSASGFEIGCDGPSVVLVGFDGSETSWRALHHAFGSARRQRSEIVVVHAEPVTSPAVALAGTSAYEGTLARTDQLRREVFDAAAQHPELKVSFAVGVGDPVRVLQQQAAERRADAIVLGASTHWGHRIAGSIAARAVRASRTPVTVVP